MLKPDEHAHQTLEKPAPPVDVDVADLNTHIIFSLANHRPTSVRLAQDSLELA